MLKTEVLSQNGYGVVPKQKKLTVPGLLRFSRKVAYHESRHIRASSFVVNMFIIAFSGCFDEDD
eukprot:2344466-Amphidinium_carterae.1